jgi:hypothetical protein
MGEVSLLTRVHRSGTAALGALLVASPLALAHINPPVVLLSDRDAMTAVLPGAASFRQATVKLSSQQKQSLQKQWRFRVEDASLRVHQGRDAQGRVVGWVVFLTQATIHAPVRLAVGVGQDGRITGAAVVEVSEESYPWVKPLIDQGFAKAFVGQGARGEFEVPEIASGRQRSMEKFYARVIATMAQWGAVLVETAGLHRTE